jgi:hypothetical protein
MDAGMLKVSGGSNGVSPAAQDMLQQLQGTLSQTQEFQAAMNELSREQQTFMLLMHARQEAMKSASDFARESMKKSQ